MPFYSCNRYRLIVLLLLVLIMWQVFRLIPEELPSNLTASDIVKLEDDHYNKHKIDKVKIRVYYEALCPDSKHFFMRHLSPVAESLQDFIEIDLVPYGKATTTEQNGKYFFVCQHGEDECYANKIHACAIETIENATAAVIMTECMIIDNLDPDAALDRCSKKLKVDEVSIKDCASTEYGSQLLMKHGYDTDLIKPTFIPTITVNGSKDNQAALLKNFLLEVCKLIDMPLPPPCL